MSKKKIEFMNTAFRDGFQSVYGARVLTQDFIPAVEACREAGINHYEAGGGARFQSLYFFCNEDAFDMMDSFRKAAGPEADLQTLARGINMVCLKSQPRDIIALHAKLFKKHGITTIRNFDALNDVNNLIDSGKAIHDAGLKHEVVVTMMELPPGCVGAHDPEFYIKTLKDILDAGIPYDSVCFKDASGTSSPQKMYETVKQARALLGEGTRIVCHTHETAGVSILQYKAAIEAGADQVDLSMAPVSGGTCQPDIMTMHHALKGTDYSLDINPEKVYEAEDVFRKCMADYRISLEAKSVEPQITLSPMPGGALTTTTENLRDTGQMDKYPAILKGMTEVVKKGGFGTSVTPVSQFYIQQSMLNVTQGPWKKIVEGYGKMVLGYFGKTPVAPDPDIVKICQEQMGLEPTTEKAVDINDRNPNMGIKAATERLEKEGLPVTDENIFIVAACEDKGVLYLKGNAVVNVPKIAPETKAAPAATPEVSSSAKADGYTVTVNGKAYSVRFQGDNKALVNNDVYEIDVKEGTDAPPSHAPVTGGTVTEVTAPMPGLVLRITAAEGESVEEGAELLVLEAMKMETPVNSPVSGTVKSIAVAQGNQVTAGQLLLEIG